MEFLPEGAGRKETACHVAKHEQWLEETDGVGLASELQQAVSNKNGFSHPTLSLDSFQFHWFHRQFSPAQ